MSRPSTLYRYLKKQIGGIVLLSDAGYGEDGRKIVECECLTCHKKFIATFHNVYRGNYKSCGCVQYGFKNKANRWSGVGEISKSYFYSLERGARSRDLEFKITLEEIWNLFLKQNRRCALSGQKLNFQSGRKHYDGTASLDRKDPSQGYVFNNLQWIHKKINYMKQSMTNEEFLNFVQIIYKYNEEK